MPRPYVEAVAGLALALIALTTAAVTIAGVRQRCGPDAAVLLEALPPLRADAVRAGIDSLTLSDDTGALPLRPGPLRLRGGQALRIRGWAQEAGGGSAAAVFAVLDDGRAIRASYGAAPAAPNPARPDGRTPFTVVVIALPGQPGAHAIRFEVVPADLRGVAEPLPPLRFAQW